MTASVKLCEMTASGPSMKLTIAIVLVTLTLFYRPGKYPESSTPSQPQQLSQHCPGEGAAVHVLCVAAGRAWEY